MFQEIHRLAEIELKLRITQKPCNFFQINIDNMFKTSVPCPRLNSYQLDKILALTTSANQPIERRQWKRRRNKSRMTRSRRKIRKETRKKK